jgi:hypothetical protein
VSKLSDYLNAHIPADWSKATVVDALQGKLDRATVYRYLAGQHPQRPAEAILEGFAAALPGASLTELRTVVGSPTGEEEPWVPTKEANRLNHAQRMALDAFIRATVNARDDTGTVEVIEELLADRRQNGQGLPKGSRTELEKYVQHLYTSGREGLADRLAASLAMSSASQTASKSAKR